MSKYLRLYECMTEEESVCGINYIVCAGVQSSRPFSCPMREGGEKTTPPPPSQQHHTTTITTTTHHHFKMTMRSPADRKQQRGQGLGSGGCPPSPFIFGNLSHLTRLTGWHAPFNGPCSPPRNA